MGIERREVRVAIDRANPVVLDVQPADTTERRASQQSFRLANISRHGMFLEGIGDEKLTHGSSIRFAMQVHDTRDGSTEVSGLARVQWVRADDQGPLKPRGFGIQVVEFDEHAERRFHQFLESCLSGLRIGDVMEPIAAAMDPSTRVIDALKRFRDSSLPCLVIADFEGTPLGTFTIEDWAKNLLKPELLEESLDQHMNRDIEVLKADQPLAVAFVQLLRGTREYLLVVEENLVVGVISTRVLFRYWIESMELETHRLERGYERAMGIIAHDLRTPIGLVQTTIQMLTSAQMTPEEFGNGGYPGVIESSCDMMLRLIDDILDLNKIKAGAVRIDLQPIDLCTIVRGVARAFAPSASAKRITLNMRLESDLPLVKADPLRIEQILNNLVSNALKFTPEGGVVLVGVTQKHARMILWVTDNGLGIHQEEIGRLFHEYACTSNRPAHGEKSIGLGLVIVKKLVEAHGGTITVDSSPGMGSTFAVELPIGDVQ